MLQFIQGAQQCPDCILIIQLRAVVEKMQSRASAQCDFEGWGTALAFLSKMMA
jgi:hypothetical protein